METLKVLIVDDEQGMCAAVERTLRNYQFYLSEVETDVNFTVTTAFSGEQGLELIQQDPPDLVLLDHKLPGMSGIDVLDRIVRLSSEIIVIMITAYATIETAVRATKQGAYDFLSKPFTPAELKYSLQKAGARVVIARRARHLAAEKKQVRFELIRVLGHELKAPLGAVANYLTMLRKQTLGNDLAAYDQIIERSELRLEQMQKLILDLLDMARIEAGKRVRQLGDTDLKTIVERSIDLFTVEANKREITLSHDLIEPLIITADPTEIEVIFNNLISNAIKYNRAGGTVAVSVVRLGEGVRIAVSDSGIGLSEKEAAKLFQEFVRIKNEKTTKILGSGLGLSIVKKIVDLYQGTVKVESEAEVGSTFVVTLPACFNKM